jgi:hypothetical protein
MPASRRKKQGFAVCLRNAGYSASIEVRKLYSFLDDPDAEANNLIRIVDESGEAYSIRPACFRSWCWRLKSSVPCAWRPNARGKTGKPGTVFAISSAGLPRARERSVASELRSPSGFPHGEALQLRRISLRFRYHTTVHAK